MFPKLLFPYLVATLIAALGWLFVQRLSKRNARAELIHNIRIERFQENVRWGEILRFRNELATLRANMRKRGDRLDEATGNSGPIQLPTSITLSRFVTDLGLNIQDTRHDLEVAQALATSSYYPSHLVPEVMVKMLQQEALMWESLGRAFLAMNNDEEPVRFPSKKAARKTDEFATDLGTFDRIEVDVLNARHRASVNKFHLIESRIDDITNHILWLDGIAALLILGLFSLFCWRHAIFSNDDWFWSRRIT